MNNKVSEIFLMILIFECKIVKISLCIPIITTKVRFTGINYMGKYSPERNFMSMGGNQIVFFRVNLNLDVDDISKHQHKRMAHRYKGCLFK